MKIAAVCDGNEISRHFGHCEAFAIYENQSDIVSAPNVVPNPGHRPGFLPVFLKDRGCNVIIAGGMGQAAVDIFNEHGIEVVLGASGSADDAVQAYLHGELASTGSVCAEHEHHHEDGSH